MRLLGEPPRAQIFDLTTMAGVEKVPENLEDNPARNTHRARIPVKGSRAQHVPSEGAGE